MIRSVPLTVISYCAQMRERRLFSAQSFILRCVLNRDDVIISEEEEEEEKETVAIRIRITSLLCARLLLARINRKS